MLEEGIATSNNPMPALKNPAYLARVANRYRQKRRLNEPSDLSFELNEEHIPDNFLQSDVYRMYNRFTMCIIFQIY